MDLFKAIVGGVVAIGLVTAVGLHAQGLTSVGNTAFSGTRGLFQTAESGK
jgi:hypothetical protein